MAAQTGKIDFCRENPLLQNRLYLCRSNIFLQPSNAEMLSIYPIYTICFCLLTFFKMAEISKMAFDENFHDFVVFFEFTIFYGAHFQFDWLIFVA
jgi:hypothetical protein